MPYIERRLYLDRFEGSLAVCTDEDENALIFSKDQLDDIRVGDVFLARIENGNALTVLDKLQKENDERHKRNRARLARLFGKSQDNN